MTYWRISFCYVTGPRWFRGSRMLGEEIVFVAPNEREALSLARKEGETRFAGRRWWISQYRQIAREKATA